MHNVALHFLLYCTSCVRKCFTTCVWHRAKSVNFQSSCALAVHMLASGKQTLASPLSQRPPPSPPPPGIKAEEVLQQLQDGFRLRPGCKVPSLAECARRLGCVQRRLCVAVVGGSGLQLWRGSGGRAAPAHTSHIP